MCKTAMGVVIRAQDLGMGQFLFCFQFQETCVSFLSNGTSFNRHSVKLNPSSKSRQLRLHKATQRQELHSPKACIVCLHLLMLMS